MKLLSAILLLLSTSDFSVAVSSGIRGAEVSEQVEPTNEQSTRRDTELQDYDKPVDSAHEIEGKVADENSPPPDDADPLEDAKITAAMMGLTLCEAEAVLRQQDEFSKLVELMEKDPSFNQAEMPDTPDGEFRVLYKDGKIPPERQELLVKFANEYNAMVKFVETKLSSEEAEERGQYFAEILEEKGYIDVSFSIDGDKIELMAKKSSPDDDCGPVVPKSLAAKILDQDETSSTMFGVQLILIDYDDDIDTVKPLYTYGGRQIRGNGSQCTTAFSVIHDSGTTGITTAAHCSGMNTYDAVLPERDYSTSFQDQHIGRRGDTEWHTTPHRELPQYYARPNERRLVTSVAGSISKGQVVCGYSRMQGIRKCDKIYKTSVSVKYSGLKRMYKLVAMRNNMMVPGDSGGPWSYGNRAFGIVSGSKIMCDSLFWGCERRDLWSRASYLPSALNVRILTVLL